MPERIQLSTERGYHVNAGYQLEFVSISRVINHMTCYKLECSHWLKLQYSDWRANLVKDLTKSTNESTRIITHTTLLNKVI